MGGMGLLMLTVNTGNLVLFLRLARQLHGDEAAERLGWVYSVWAGTSAGRRSRWEWAR